MSPRLVAGGPEGASQGEFPAAVALLVLPLCPGRVGTTLGLCDGNGLHGPSPCPAGPAARLVLQAPGWAQAPRSFEPGSALRRLVSL